jgi:uncharacterized protein (DUF885 family)
MKGFLMNNLQTATTQLQQLIADEWAFRLKEDPLFATEVGDHRFDDQLPVIGEADFQRRAEQARAFLDRLELIERGQLSPSDQLNYDIFRRVKQDEIAEYEFRAYRMPLDRMGGFHTNFVELPDLLVLNTLTDYENYLARLNGFNAYAAQHVELMRVGLREGQIPSAVALAGVERAVREQVVDDPAQSRLYKPFMHFPATLVDAHRQRLSDRARNAIAQSVVPGYQALLKFLVEEYLPAARSDIAASALPNGRAFYEHRVRLFTTLDLTPQQVHGTGLAEVQRIRAEMAAIIQRVGFEGDFQAFIQFLRTDSRFYVDTPAALMKEVSLILKKLDGELPRLFKTLPRMPYGIKPVPDYIAPHTTTAYYLQPSGDGTRAGFYYVNTYDLKSRPLYELAALSLHEAVPGHHLQIALQQEIEALPNFRRFGGFTAFIEGWGLYAERLGLEVGFYQDPYSDFGRLTYEMWRACRLVVDTGMHYLGWTRQQAIDLMAENTALTLLNVANEVDRYIAMPGQALAYKTGELKIRELRSLAERELGANFDLRTFHDVLLRDGALPLDVLETTIKHWIAGQKT